jgi:subtilisin family serine protease
LSIAAACLVAVAGSLNPVLQAAPPARNEVQLLVKPKASMPEAALHALLSAQGAREQGAIDVLGVRVISVPVQAADKLMAALQRNKDVEYAEPDHVATAVLTANDPRFTGGGQWSLSKIEAPAAWDTTVGSENVVVAVVDSGVSASHPDLTGKVLRGYDFVNGDTDASDDNGHGTAVAGITAASTNNGVGMAGVSWNSMILPVKVLGANGSGSYSAMANGITWAADNGARIINLSLGGTSSSRTLQNAVNYAWSRNIILVAAAGNNGNSTPVYPGACANVVAVSATDSVDSRPSWSNYGSYVDVAAPGVNVLTLSGANSYANWNGTSFSSPVTAGVVALMAAGNPGLSNAGVVDALLRNSDDIGAAGYDVYYGQGRVNARRAVAAVANTVPSDSTPPSVAFGSPSGGATLAGTVNVNLSASDNVGVTKVEFYIGGVLYGQSNSATASFSWDTTTYLDGAYTLEARAYDTANNTASNSITVNIKNSTVTDTTAPLAKITSPADGSKLSGRTVKVNVSSSDNVGVTKVELYIDGKLFGTSTSSTASFSWNISKISSGAHTLRAYAFDAAGNIGTSHLVTVYK